jgi:hypothetical protein
MSASAVLCEVGLHLLGKAFGGAELVAQCPHRASAAS